MGPDRSGHRWAVALLMVRLETAELFEFLRKEQRGGVREREYSKGKDDEGEEDEHAVDGSSRKFQPWTRRRQKRRCWSFHYLCTMDDRTDNDSVRTQKD